jgi:hypothetical protein
MSAIKMYQRIEFNSELQKANGKWEVYYTMDGLNGEDPTVMLRKILPNGKAAKPNNRNVLAIPQSIVVKAIEIGNAKLI